MKRLTILLAALCLMTALAGCGGSGGAQARPAPSGGSTVSQLLEEAGKEPSAAEASPSDEAPSPATEPVVLSETEGIDIDLTLLSSTMVYAEVAGLMFEPDDYVGKVIRVRGESVSFYYEETDTTYHNVLVSDATACCAQGIEYLLPEGAEYPPDGVEITVTGEFELYEEEGLFYCRLKDAVME